MIFIYNFEAYDVYHRKPQTVDKAPSCEGAFLVS